jgi:hypothetical protein
VRLPGRASIAVYALGAAQWLFAFGYFFAESPWRQGLAIFFANFAAYFAMALPIIAVRRVWINLPVLLAGLPATFAISQMGRDPTGAEIKKLWFYMNIYGVSALLLAAPAIFIFVRGTGGILNRRPRDR